MCQALPLRIIPARLQLGLQLPGAIARCRRAGRIALDLIEQIKCGGNFTLPRRHSCQTQCRIQRIGLHTSFNSRLPGLCKELPCCGPVSLVERELPCIIQHPRRTPQITQIQVVGNRLLKVLIGFRLAAFRLQ